MLDRLKAALSERYTVLRQLGEGGMAVVYLADDRKHHRQVAIKVLRPEIGAALGAQRFLREIEIAAKLTHPHILPLYDSGEADGALYYVMPYVEGESLRDRIDSQGKLGVDEAIRLADQIASALTFAHERGVIHRDIKPENIMLAGNQAIVADFGIARAVASVNDTRLTGTGLAIGTPAYMSPEQAAGSTDVDERSDIYALACVFYEMVGGKPPFSGDTPQALLAHHFVDMAPRLRTADSSIPLFVDRAVERAMVKSPEDRFASAAEFANALTTGTVVARVRRRNQRRRWRVAVVSAVPLILFAWILIALEGGQRVERIAVLPLANLASMPDQEYLLTGVHEALISEVAQLGIPVIARATMRRYEGTSKSITEIAEELNVDAVVEGSLFREGDSLEITARLYDGANEEELWSGSYDGAIPNAVAMYRAFARSIAEEIEVSLSPTGASRLESARPVNPLVYEAYLKGMYHLNQSTPEHFEQALTYFEEAVEKNPADPFAYAGTAAGYATLAHGPSPPPDAWRIARAAAERAIRLDSTLAEAWAVLANVKMYYEWDWENAERSFLKAAQLNPSLAMNHYHYAWFLALFGRVDEAIAEHELAKELDPLTPLHTVWIPGLYYHFGRFEDALTRARTLVLDYPDNATLLTTLAQSAVKLGHFDEAVTAIEKAVAINDRWMGIQGRVYAAVGRTEDAARILARLEAEPPSPWIAWALADLQVGLGNEDEAFRWLRYTPTHAYVPWARNYPHFEPLHDDPRFKDFLDWLGLPPVSRSE